MAGAGFVSTTKDIRPEVDGRAYRVIVESGPDAGASLVVGRESVNRSLVGTSPACDLRLTDPLVSRRHIVLEATASGLQVVDVGSTNGTSIHSVRVREASIDVGARIAIGDTTLRVEQADEAGQPAPEADAFGGMVGVSRASRRLFAVGQRLAASAIPVLLEGESGTGKMLFAESLHEAGGRTRGPFVVFDASSVPSTRAGPILFGAGGPGTPSSSEDHVGLWERSTDGTLYVGEASLLPSDVQRRIVRLVEAQAKGRKREDNAGGVRLVVGTRGDLDTAVDDGRVREDFFHLFLGARVPILPLRARPDDIAALAQHFWSELGDPAGGEVPAVLLERLQSHSWPGNVRELEAVVARHATTGDLAALPRLAARNADGGFVDLLLERELPITQARELMIEHFERRYLERVLKRHENVPQAAAASGLATRYFRSLKAEYGYRMK